MNNYNLLKLGWVIIVKWSFELPNIIFQTHFSYQKISILGLYETIV